MPLTIVPSSSTEVRGVGELPMEIEEEDAPDDMDRRNSWSPLMGVGIVLTIGAMLDTVRVRCVSKCKIELNGEEIGERKEEC